MSTFQIRNTLKEQKGTSTSQGIDFKFCKPHNSVFKKVFLRWLKQVLLEAKVDLTKLLKTGVDLLFKKFSKYHKELIKQDCYPNYIFNSNKQL